ncbi:MAG: 16S rRNA (uracil(1498)-N(3))-methyltransferase [Bacilli bacterium]|nr:16S rRNA (uracil(1498)-N(3))-methyltransferase [Bacilli bacterium]
MQRYFCNIVNDRYKLNKEDSHHITKVMRCSVGDKIEIVDNGSLFIAEIIELTPIVIAKVKEKVNMEENSINVTIAQSLVNEQKMDYILQKGTELGAIEFIPLITDRSIVKINDKINKKITRWNLITKEASEQSKRLTIPKVREPQTIQELIKLDYDYKILCSVNEVSKSIKTVLSNIKESDRILVVIGPEGGFSKEEENKMIDNGFISVSLGSRVLRTETASLAVLSFINYIFMR